MALEPGLAHVLQRAAAARRPDPDLDEERLAPRDAREQVLQNPILVVLRMNLAPVHLEPRTEPLGTHQPTADRALGSVEAAPQREVGVLHPGPAELLARPAYQSPPESIRHVPFALPRRSKHIKSRPPGMSRPGLSRLPQVLALAGSHRRSRTPRPTGSRSGRRGR